MKLYGETAVERPCFAHGFTAALKHCGGAALEFLYPTVCIVCGSRTNAKTAVVCKPCWQKLPRNSRNVISQGTRTVGRKTYFSYIAWRFEYSENLRAAVHFFKFNDFSNLAARFGREMTETLLSRTELAAADALVPVPLHRARMRERGYNQSELLASVISLRADIPVARALERIKNNRPQASLASRAEKITNVKGIFQQRSGFSVRGKRVLLIDDVVTTGATVNECAKVLTRAGAREIMVLAASFAR